MGGDCGRHVGFLRPLNVTLTVTGSIKYLSACGASTCPCAVTTHKTTQSGSQNTPGTEISFQFSKHYTLSVFMSWCVCVTCLTSTFWIVFVKIHSKIM